MKAFTYNLHLLDPVLVNQIGGGDPNSAVGFDYIPGSVIRGAIIGMYLQSRKTKDMDASDEEFRNIFFNDNVLFLNAYPFISERRALPVPLSWRSKKDEKNQVYDNSICDRLEFDEDGLRIIWTSVSEPFCILANDNTNASTLKYCPDKCVTLHTARGDRSNVTGKKKESSVPSDDKSTMKSTMFRYESLDSDQAMCGVILVKDEACSEILSKILCENKNEPLTLKLGKSHLAEYGRVRLENLKIQDNWKEYEPVGEDGEEFIVVTLLSDAIIRDEQTGSYIGNISPALGIKDPIKRFVQISIKGGFNRKWNLPLPQIQVIVAGSVFVYENTDGLRDTLNEFEMLGIGEKREDGFGRIAIDWHKEDEFEIAEFKKDTKTINNTLTEENIPFISKIAERLLKVKLDQLLLEKINDSKIKSPPKNAQVSGIRNVMRDAFVAENPCLVIKYLSKMKRKARDQFQHARVNDMSLYEWIESSFQNPPKVWGDMNALSASCSLGEIKASSMDNLSLEYTFRLIDGVLHKAQKEVNND